MKFRKAFYFLAVAGLIATGLSQKGGAHSEVQKITPKVLSNIVDPGSKTSVLVYLKDQADFSYADSMLSRTNKSSFVYNSLRLTAAQSQKSLVKFLSSAHVSFRQFYITNMIAIDDASGELIMALSQRPEVKKIASDTPVRLDIVADTSLSRQETGPKELQENITSTGASEVWGQFHTKGEGIVIAGQDTGVQWDHPALKAHYRGIKEDGSVDHSFSWHDSIHKAISEAQNPCGYDLKTPCDDDRHGTHTMGTMIGDDGGDNKIGMAPGAKWIACRNMDKGTGRPSTYLECFQYFLAPYPQGADPMAAGDPSKAPNVINNSWGCTSEEGCKGEEYKDVLKALKTAGIMVVVSAGNDGPGCGSINSQPATISESILAVGAHNHRDGKIAYFSSRGPSTLTGVLGPDITAPGVSIRSSVPGNSYEGGQWSGTSMAGPHVAGAVALLWSAFPALKGKVDTTIAILRKTADASAGEEACGGIAADAIPNNTYGFGRMNVLAAAKVAASGTF